MNECLIEIRSKIMLIEDVILLPVAPVGLIEALHDQPPPVSSAG